MFEVRKKHLLAINGCLWFIVGVNILRIGVSHYLAAPREDWRWMLLLSALVFAGFFFMFAGVVRKYAKRIQNLPGPKESVFKTFSLKGYLIIAFMITLGITLKHIPGIPESFFAWFYLGLGAGLISAGVRFLIRWFIIH